MISLDVNVLVYAFRQDSVKHEECRDWLNEQIRNRNGLVLIDIVLVGFLRICTHFIRIIRDTNEKWRPLICRS